MAAIRVVALCFAGVLLAGCCALPPDENFADDLSTTPGVLLAAYDVTGKDTKQIWDSILRARLRDPRTGEYSAGLTQWYISWNWNTSPDGTCDLSGAAVSFTALVTLPRLANPVSPAVAAKWDALLRGLRIHEAGHVDFAKAEADAMLTAIKVSTCDKASDVATAIIEKIRRHDIDYDAQTKHGLTQTPPFP